MTDLSQEIAAALAEMTYRRSSSDQALDLADISGELNLGNAALADVQLGQTPRGLTPDGSGYYYDDSMGFVGRVVSSGDTVYVVYRGTDMAGGIGAYIAANLGFSDASDPHDFNDANFPLGQGTTWGTQLDGSLQPVPPS